MNDFENIDTKEITKQFRNKVVKAIGGYGTAIAIIIGFVLFIVFGNNAEHQNAFIATLVLMPLFCVQVLLLTIPALAINYLVLWVRSRKIYDEHGPVRELKMVQDRVGTDSERPYDSIALGLQFLANSILIATVILCFFLMRSGASLG